MASQSISTIYEKWARPLIAEFLGQLIFAFLHSSTVNTISVPTSSGVSGNALLPAISDGLTVFVLIIAIGKISGCHVNFAVTLAVALGGGMKVVMVPLYLIAQVLGSLAGAGIAFATSNGAFGQFTLQGDTTIQQGLVMEIMLTTILVVVILMAAVELNAVHAAFAISFIILINIMAGFNITGGCMNPTLSFGPAVVAGEWTNYWIYWVGPILGAIMAAIIFRIFLGEKSRLFFRSNPPMTESQDDVKMEKGIENTAVKNDTQL